jgi:hypothetical protein
MRRPGTRQLGILLLSMTSIFPEIGVAEIYKWVDAHGKVHFGDKPQDPVIARDAQPVELRESYRPSARTAQEQEAYDNEQRNIMLRDQMRRGEDKKAQEDAEDQRRKKKAELCATYEEGIKELSTMEVKNGVRTMVYLKGEDGKPVSSERQREIVEELKAKMADAGCT